MTESPYLVGLALVEQEGTRLMPISGRSLSRSNSGEELAEGIASKISLELLTRLLERSENGAIRRVNNKQSILLVKISIESMQNVLPNLKSKWIKEGETELFISKLKEECEALWSLSFTRYEGIKFLSIS